MLLWPPQCISIVILARFSTWSTTPLAMCHGPKPCGTLRVMWACGYALVLRGFWFYEYVFISFLLRQGQQPFESSPCLMVCLFHKIKLDYSLLTHRKANTQHGGLHPRALFLGEHPLFQKWTSVSCEKFKPTRLLFLTSPIRTAFIWKFFGYFLCLYLEYYFLQKYALVYLTFLIYWHQFSSPSSRISYLNTTRLETLSTPQRRCPWTPQLPFGSLASRMWTFCWRQVKTVWVWSGVPSPPRHLQLARWRPRRSPLLTSPSCISNNVIS